MESPAVTEDVIKTAFNVFVKLANQGDNVLPDDSSRSILAFDNHIHAVEALLSTLKQSRNTLASIHILPEELLVNVWLLCVQEATQIDVLLHTLALVCKSWYRGVLDHPVLWCYLQVYCTSKRYNDWVLQKSQNCPLHLRLSSEDPHASDELINMVIPECRRWKSIVLTPCIRTRDVVIDPDLMLLTGANLDNLTSFEAEVNPDWGPPESFSLPATPALRVVKLERYSLCWRTFNAPQLRALRINALGFHAPSFSQLLNVLRSTPFLEILLLKDTNFPMSPPDPPSHKNSPVNVPRLRALYLSFPARAPCDDLLRLIRTETLQQLLGRTVSFDLWEPPRFTILNNIKSLIPPTGAIYLSYFKDVHIQTNPHPFYPAQWPYHDDALTTEGFAFTSAKPAKMVDFLDIAQWVSSLGAHTIVKLELGNPWRRRGQSREIPVALLDHLPTLQTLVIRKGVNVDAFFAQLGRPKRESSGRLHWPWPQLVNLDLGNSDGVTAEVLVDLAQSRWGNANISLSTSEPSVEPTEERPAKLKSLAIPDTFPIQARQQVETLALEGGPRPQSRTGDYESLSNPSSE
ncbi:hypothetical protein M407DRAFT_19721 [Tulasnella calospora MUT 4182]|uniref:F-box domain-containing protein n=1 Tax=Tulasnella calospora MUT 4182 TaxID=1051891 RepID=A0A0C3QRJ8_9AGAM|nr:hypothetical protein M407DRAFT_19721 [Tulasnella calospora MUT 4182]